MGLTNSVASAVVYRKLPALCGLVVGSSFVLMAPPGYFEVIVDHVNQQLIEGSISYTVDPADPQALRIFLAQKQAFAAAALESCPDSAEFQQLLASAEAESFKLYRNGV